MTTIRCRGGCGTWFPKSEDACPKCGTPKHRTNVALASEIWRSNLNAQAAHAAKYA